MEVGSQCKKCKKKPCCKKNQNTIILEPIAESIKVEKNWKNKILLFYPLIISFFYVLLGSIFSEYPFDDFNGKDFLRSIMGFMLIIFSYLKMLNPSGFIMSFKKYDYLTSKFVYYGYIYPLIEIMLGIFILINVFYIFTNAAIIILFSINLTQVIIVLKQGKELECACLGSLGFKLPLSQVTIIEDVIMIIMSIIMLSI